MKGRADAHQLHALRISSLEAACCSTVSYSFDIIMPAHVLLVTKHQSSVARLANALQVLEIVEQLLRPSDLLGDMDAVTLPPNSHAARFLTSLGDMLASEPAMGTVLR